MYLVLLFYGINKVVYQNGYDGNFSRCASGLLKVEKGSSLGRSPSGHVPVIRLSIFTKSAISLLISDRNG